MPTDLFWVLLLTERLWEWWLVRETRPKIQHKAIIWGMYVTAAFRRTGVGRTLLTELVERARSMARDLLFQ